MAKPRSVTVVLRAGVSDATLPDNRKMVPNVQYAISLSDFSKIARNARESIITSTVNTSPYIVPLYNNANFTLDLTTIHDKTSVANVNADAQAAKDFVLGDVVQGFDGTAFKLVKLNGTGTANVTSTTNVGVWFNKTANEVSIDTSADLGEFAGVWIGTISDGNFGWIQIAGDVDAAAANANVTAGEPIAVSTSSDSQFTAPGVNEEQTITATSAATGGTFTIAFSGQTTSALAYNASAATIQTALEALSNIGVGNIAVTQTTGTGGLDTNADVMTLVFRNALGNTDVAAVTTDDTLLTSGGTPDLTVATSVAGVAGSAVSVGTALTTSGSTLSDVALRDVGFANRHFKTTKLFLEKN